MFRFKFRFVPKNVQLIGIHWKQVLEVNNSTSHIKQSLARSNSFHWFILWGII